MLNYKKTTLRPGLTITELIVAITLSSIVLLSAIPLLIHMVSMGTTYTKTGKQIADIQRVMDTIESDLAVTKFFHDESSEDTHSPRSNVDDTWRIDSTPSALILETPGTTLPYQNADRMLVYDANSGDCDPTSLGDTTTPVYIQTIYYVYEGNLYRRTIPPSDFSTCNGAALAQLKSCLPDDSCSQRDALIAGNITKFDISYFQGPQDNEPDDSVFQSVGSGVMQNLPYEGVEITVESTIAIGDRQSIHSLTLRDSLVIQEQI